MTKTSARILLYDLEVSPNLGYAYGMWDTRILKIKEYASIMSISWKWLGDETIHHASLANIPRKRGTSSNKALTMVIHQLFDEADIVIAHNAYKFDNRVATAAFLRHGIAPPSPYKTVDTLRVARSQAMFPGGNSLNELGSYLGVGNKSDITVRDLWFDCLQGDMKAWKLLEEYNNQDIVVLEGVYYKLLPYIRNYPNLGDILQRDGVCPKCGSVRLQRRGFNTRRNGKVQRYQCSDCGGWCSEANIKRKGRTVNAI